MAYREWSESYAAARAEAIRLAEWTAQLRAESGRTVDESRRLRERLRRERYGSDGSRADPPQPHDAER